VTQFFVQRRRKSGNFTGMLFAEAITARRRGRRSDLVAD